MITHYNTGIKSIPVFYGGGLFRKQRHRKKVISNQMTSSFSGLNWKFWTKLNNWVIVFCWLHPFPRAYSVSHKIFWVLTVEIYKLILLECIFRLFCDFKIRAFLNKQFFLNYMFNYISIIYIWNQGCVGILTCIFRLKNHATTSIKMKNT